ncbi:MAG: nuclear transport factor 2 family protein [Saprospiraceae bacterium]|nr:nuclear transport factor 2 family protein [Saprospiraceae bacterium]
MKYLKLLAVAALFVSGCQMNNGTIKLTMEDKEILSELNSQFILNYITQNAVAHSEIIHSDFVCIENSGRIIGRKVYLKNWETDYQNSGVDTFYHTDEDIRIFGDMALVRSKSVYSLERNGERYTGASIYTDTYIREDGKWRCVQAQMTPLK